MKLKMMFLVLLMLGTFSVASAADYHIGPDQTYTSISAFTGWTSLLPGDHVYIHYGTYAEMILLCQSGTSGNPIVIEGVPDGSGNLPILTGDNMVIPSQFDGHLSEYDLGGGKLAQGYGLIFVERSNQDDAWGTRPEYVTVKNLEIKSNTPESYTFTNSNGVSQAYPDGNAGVYIRNGKDILLENLTIHDTGNGVEVQGVDTMAQNITIRGSHLYDFGRTDGRLFLEHGLYTEVSELVVEYCVIGPAREGTSNSTIKSRGAGTVLRYNVMYAGSRLLDLVEPENQSAYSCGGVYDNPGGMQDQPGWSESWVYGNVFINEVNGTRPVSSYPIHYGYDNCPDSPRDGTLYFYDNTVIHDIPAATYYYSEIFDLAPSGTIALYNNVIASLGDTHLSLARHSKSTSIGEFVWLGGNWVTSGYADFKSGYTGTWTETVTILDGSNTGLFTDAANGDFSVPTGSPLLDAAVALPASITTAHDVALEYLATRSYQTRTDLADIGAFYSDGIAVDGGEPPNVSDGESPNVSDGETPRIIHPPFLHPLH